MPRWAPKRSLPLGRATSCPCPPSSTCSGRAPQLRQLGDVGGDATSSRGSSLAAAAYQLLLEIHVGERLTVGAH